MDASAEELLLVYLRSRLWRDTSRPLPELEALADDELLALAATVPDLASGLESWRRNLDWLGMLTAAEGLDEEAPAPVKKQAIPGFDRPVSRALKLHQAFVATVGK